MYPLGRVDVLLNAYKLYPSYGHKFSFFKFIFLNNSEYIMLQELPPSINIWNTSKWKILEIMIKGKISFRIPLTFSLSQIRVSIYPGSWLRSFRLSYWQTLTFLSSFSFPLLTRCFPRGTSYNGYGIFPYVFSLPLCTFHILVSVYLGSWLRYFPLCSLSFSLLTSLSMVAVSVVPYFPTRQINKWNISTSSKMSLIIQTHHIFTT